MLHIHVTYIYIFYNIYMFFPTLCIHFPIRCYIIMHSYRTQVNFQRINTYPNTSPSHKSTVPVRSRRAQKAQKNKTQKGVPREQEAGSAERVLTWTHVWGTTAMHPWLWFSFQGVGRKLLGRWSGARAKVSMHVENKCMPKWLT